MFVYPFIRLLMCAFIHLLTHLLIIFIFFWFLRLLICLFTVLLKTALMVSRQVVVVTSLSVTSGTPSPQSSRSATVSSRTASTFGLTSITWVRMLVLYIFYLGKHRFLPSLVINRSGSWSELPVEYNCLVLGLNYSSPKICESRFIIFLDILSVRRETGRRHLGFNFCLVL